MSCGGICNCIFIMLTLLTSVLISLIPLGLFFKLDEDESGEKPKLTNTTITDALNDSDYYPQAHLIMSASLVLLVFVAIAREIQLAVLFQRIESYSCCIRFINIMSVLILIAGAVNFILTVMITKRMNALVHAITAVLAIFLALGYAFFNIVLTLIQRCKSGFEDYGGCCSKYFELFFSIPLFIVSLVANIVFGIDQLREDVLGITEESRTILEWIGFWTLFATFTMLAVTFFRDPVGDELKEFFSKMCCMCCTNNKNKNKQGLAQMEMSSV